MTPGQVARRAFGIGIDPPPAPSNSVDGCRCGAATDSPTRFGPWFVLLLAVFTFGRRRSAIRSAGFAAGTSILMSSLGSPAWAQSGAGYYVESRREPYIRRTGGTPLLFADANDGSATVDIPFNFDFFGVVHRRMTVSANGYVTFGSIGDAWLNQALPNAIAPNALIAMVWDDLEGNLASWHIEGTAPDRVGIVQFALSSRRGRALGGRPQVQLWLYEAGVGRFELRYGGIDAMTDPSVWSATLGFENELGSLGRSVLSCGANCTGNDIASLSGHVWRADRDAGPELIATAIAASGPFDPGLPRSVTLRFRSLHGRSVGPWAWGLRSSASPGVDLLRRVTTLGPFEQRTVSATVALPLDTPPGELQLALIVDADDVIAEVNRSEQCRDGAGRGGTQSA